MSLHHQKRPCAAHIVLGVVSGFKFFSVIQLLGQTPRTLREVESFINSTQITCESVATWTQDK